MPPQISVCSGRYYSAEPAPSVHPHFVVHNRRSGYVLRLFRDYMEPRPSVERYCRGVSLLNIKHYGAYLRILCKNIFYNQVPVPLVSFFRQQYDNFNRTNTVIYRIHYPSYILVSVRNNERSLVLIQRYPFLPFFLRCAVLCKIQFIFENAEYFCQELCIFC